jgi:hypothetical protein
MLLLQNVLTFGICFEKNAGFLSPTTITCLSWLGPIIFGLLIRHKILFKLNRAQTHPRKRLLCSDALKSVKKEPVIKHKHKIIIKISLELNSIILCVNRPKTIKLIIEKCTKFSFPFVPSMRMCYNFFSVSLRPRLRHRPHPLI